MIWGYPYFWKHPDMVSVKKRNTLGETWNVQFFFKVERAPKIDSDFFLWQGIFLGMLRPAATWSEQHAVCQVSFLQIPSLKLTYPRKINSWKMKLPFEIWLGLSPLPVTVTTRIITFLVGDPYKPSFATVTGRGDNPRYGLFSEAIRSIYKEDAPVKLWSCLIQIYDQNLNLNPFEQWKKPELFRLYKG